MEEVTRHFLDANQPLIRLAIALLLGSLIGIERGWVARGQQAGERIAGIRTHALVGLLGGIAALLSTTVSAWAFPLVFLAVAGIALVAWRERLAERQDYSITALITSNLRPASSSWACSLSSRPWISRLLSRITAVATAQAVATAGSTSTATAPKQKVSSRPIRPVML